MPSGTCNGFQEQITVVFYVISSIVHLFFEGSLVAIMSPQCLVPLLKCDIFVCSMESEGSLKKVLSRSITFDVLDSAKRRFSECVKVETLRNCIDKRWSPFICIMALSNVVGLPIL